MWARDPRTAYSSRFFYGSARELSSLRKNSTIFSVQFVLGFFSALKSVRFTWLFDSPVLSAMYRFTLAAHCDRHAFIDGREKPGHAMCPVLSKLRNLPVEILLQGFVLLLQLLYPSPSPAAWPAPRCARRSHCWYCPFSPGPSWIALCPQPFSCGRRRDRQSLAVSSSCHVIFKVGGCSQPRLGSSADSSC